MNKYFKNEKFNKIIQNIKINTDNNLRDIFDSAVSFQYSTSDKPIEYNERNIKRIMVNSIRHDYSNYEDGLKQVHRLKMEEDIYFRYKNIILNCISIQYPFLKDECERQKNNINMVNIIYPAE